MINAKFHLNGLADIYVNLKEISDVLGGNEAGKPARNALYKAARSIKNRAIKKAEAIDRPETPEKIFLNIAVRAMKYPQREGGNIGYRIGVLGGAKDLSKQGEIMNPNRDNPGGDTWYWRLVEFGTEHSAAKPFMRPAMTEGREEAMEIFASEMRKEIEKALRKFK
jgi:HK97 gp10 family phage protein